MNNATAEQSALNEAMRRRYGDQVPDIAQVWNQTLATILSHASIRRFLPRALPAGTLELLVAAAQSAATSSNLQSWSVVAVQDTQRKSRLAKIAGNQDFIAQCPLFLVWVADLHRLKRCSQERSFPAGALEYLETFVVALIDVALAAQNATVALESMGLGTVYVGAVRNAPDAVAAEIGLPEMTIPLFGMCVGYPDTTVKRAVKPRLTQRAVLHRERYDWEVQREPIEQYDRKLTDFWMSQGQAPTTWTDAVARRVSGLEAMHGREHLRQMLTSFGFELR